MARPKKKNEEEGVPPHGFGALHPNFPNNMKKEDPGLGSDPQMEQVESLKKERDDYKQAMEEAAERCKTALELAQARLERAELAEKELAQLRASNDTFLEIIDGLRKEVQQIDEAFKEVEKEDNALLQKVTAEYASKTWQSNTGTLLSRRLNQR